jgi:hypothetical protein
VSNSGPGTAHGVVLTDTLPTNAGLSWTVDGGTAAATCSISGGILTCNIGDLASGASATVHISSPTTTATCGTVNNTGHVTTTNDGSDQSSASITVTCPVISSLQPTATTCSQFLQGTNQPITQIQYSVKGNPSKINQTNPGVFFYFVQLTFSTSGSKTVTVTQANTTLNNVVASPLFPVQSIQVFSVVPGTTTCNNVSLTGSSTGNPAAASATFNASATTTYVVAVKYSTSSIGGSPAPNPTTQQYTYATQNVANSSQSLNLVKK